ncbi:hypothetical protein SAMN05192558_101632 [Actinokineospora alba]|uniref:Uncharacterized protein n=1 Tax=Actinokineospora alba TaxID=504798 RepID=A0A1H0G2R3_9PSEU|nr:hypothetical protein [Actinokineospora alba]TDP69733.1 hypothetical protein C8E96_5327 [Actinokineospora alba]SDI09911.1 hypothetical protein SAMN05421871_103239 [Actinokineospora alba]SDO01121.1 hypothetical protein SAMN05192558_101632 [Actinokineospora alba]
MSRSVLWRGAAVLVAAVAAVTFVTPAHAAGPDMADGLEVYSGDVFEIVGSTLRNPTAETDPSAPLFGNSGVGLNRTWGEWSAATASSVVRSSGGRSPRTDVRLSFAGLVPGGVYSVFWGTLTPDSENPLCPGVERTLALPSVDAGQAPDASSFVAAADGTAAFRGKLDGSLLDSALQVFFSVIYHFDGQTYGALPNAGEFQTQGPNCRSSFGEDAMRHLLILQKW